MILHDDKDVSLLEGLYSVTFWKPVRSCFCVFYVLSPFMFISGRILGNILWIRSVMFTAFQFRSWIGAPLVTSHGQGIRALVAQAQWKRPWRLWATRTTSHGCIGCHIQCQITWRCRWNMYLDTRVFGTCGRFMTHCTRMHTVGCGYGPYMAIWVMPTISIQFWATSSCSWKWEIGPQSSEFHISGCLQARLHARAAIRLRGRFRGVQCPGWVYTSQQWLLYRSVKVKACESCWSLQAGQPGPANAGLCQQVDHQAPALLLLPGAKSMYDEGTGAASHSQWLLQQKKCGAGRGACAQHHGGKDQTCPKVHSHEGGEMEIDMTGLCMTSLDVSGCHRWLEQIQFRLRRPKTRLWWCPGMSPRWLTQSQSMWQFTSLPRCLEHPVGTGLGMWQWGLQCSVAIGTTNQLHLINSNHLWRETHNNTQIHEPSWTNSS